jgi:hypothetical protein
MRTLGHEETGGIHQQVGIHVLIGELLTDIFHHLPVGEIGGDPIRGVVVAEHLDRLIHSMLVLADDDDAPSQSCDLHCRGLTHSAAATHDDKLLV